MKNSNFILPKLVNEDVKDYKKGSPERKEVQDEYDKMYNENIDIPLYIGSDEILTEKRIEIKPPHDNKKTVGINGNTKRYWFGSLGFYSRR